MPSAWAVSSPTSRALRARPDRVSQVVPMSRTAAGRPRSDQAAPPRLPSIHSMAVRASSRFSEVRTMRLVRPERRE